MSLHKSSVVLFTDSVFHQDLSNNIYPLRDQFVRFVSKLEPHVQRLTVASRCKMRVTVNTVHEGDYLNLSETLTFAPLPYYANTEDYYKRYLSINTTTKRRIEELIDEADIVFLRIHHAMGPAIFRQARRASKPLMAYWAGPPIIESATANYNSQTLKGKAAMAIAKWKQRQHKKIAQSANWNCFLDQNEYRLMGSPERVSWVAPNLITEDAIVDAVKPRTPDEPLQITFIGRMYRHKGIFDLLDATQRFVEQGYNIKLTFAGQGPDEARFRQAVTDRGLTQFVDVLGGISHDRVTALLRESHVLTLPSYGEGVPKVMWEAWAAGAPVIMSDVGGIGQYLVNGENGLLIAPGRVEQLASALLELETCEEYRCQLAENGLETVEKHTWNKAIESVAAALNAAIHHHQSRIVE